METNFVFTRMKEFDSSQGMENQDHDGNGVTGYPLLCLDGSLPLPPKNRYNDDTVPLGVSHSITNSSIPLPPKNRYGFDVVPARVGHGITNGKDVFTVQMI